MDCRCFTQVSERVSEGASPSDVGTINSSSCCHWLRRGILSGVFGIGGGVVIVPALIYLAGFNQHRATGTSLAVLLPPIGLAATWEYYWHHNVDVRAAMTVAAAVFVGGWFGAVIANRVSGPYLRLAFGVFVVVLGVSLIVGAFRRLGWL